MTQTEYDVLSSQLDRWLKIHTTGGDVVNCGRREAIKAVHEMIDKLYEGSSTHGGNYYTLAKDAKVY